MRRLNPYVYGPSVSGTQFTGREDELQQLVARILEPPIPLSCSIVGETRIGKSSLLNAFRQMVEDEQREDLLCLHYDMSSDFRNLLTEDEKRGNAGAGAFYRNFVTRISADLSDYPKFNHEAAQKAGDANLPPFFMTSNIQNFFRSIRRAGYWLLLILDEFDSITEYFRFDSSGWMLLRTLGSDQSYGLCYLFASRCSISTLEHNAGSSSNLASIFETIRLELMSSSEARELVDEPIKHGKLQWNPQQSELILLTGGNHPYCLQMICAHLFRQQARGTIPPDLDEMQLIHQLQTQYTELFEMQRRRLEQSHLFEVLLRIAHGVPLHAEDRQIDELVQLGYLCPVTGIRNRFRPFSQALDYYLRACGMQEKLWPIVEETEASLHQLVEREYQARFGDRWLEEIRQQNSGGHPDAVTRFDMVTRWEMEREQENHNPFVVLDKRTSLIQQASILDLKQLISQQAELFQSVFPGQTYDLLEKTLTQLHTIRDAEKGRYRRISDEEVTRTEKACEKLLHIIQPFLEQNTTLPPEHPQKGETPAMLEPPERYVDFHLRIDRHGHFIAHSGEGEAQADCLLAIPSNIDLALDLIAVNTKNATLYRNLGRQLYDLIFPASIHTHLQKTEAVARDRKQKIRIRLDIEAETLARLPLEFLYREDRGYFLAIDPHTALSRYLHLSYPRNHVRRRTGSLRMLIIISSPSDQIALNINQWSNAIVQALAEPVKQQRLVLEFVTSGTYEEISHALLKHKPDIIQFVGHGIYQDKTGYLALANEDGSTWLVDDASFANLLLGSMDNLGLVCLASCESAVSNNLQGFLGLAPQLIQRGVPAVIAMQYSVKVSTAEIFFRHLYQNIAEHKPIDWAVQQARNAVSIKKGCDNREFATPVLYMRAEDGDIF